MQTFKRRIASALAVLLAISVGVVTSTPAKATVQIPVTRVDVGDVLANETISGKNGQVTAATCSSANGSIGTKTIAPNGDVVGTTPVIPGTPMTWPALMLCDGQKAVGKDGTLYGTDPTGYPVEKLAAYAATGTFKWVQTLSVPGCTSPLTPIVLRMGKDGNLYVLGQPTHSQCGGHAWLYSYKPNGTLRWQQDMGNQYVSYMNTYNTGVVAVAGSAVKYWGYDGVAQPDVPMFGPGPFTPNGSNAQGMMVVSTFGYSADGACGSGSKYVTKTISGYMPSGRTLFYEPNCMYAYPVAPLQNGGVAFTGDGYLDSLNRTVVLMYNATTGITSVTQHIVWPASDGQRTFGAGMGVIGETNGNVLTYRRYTRESGRYQGTQFTLVRVADGAVTSVFNTDSLDATKSISIGEESISLAPGRLYFTSVECGGWSCSTLDPRFLYGVPMAQLGMDYPRGTVLGVAKVAVDNMAVLGDSFSSGLGSLNLGQEYEHLACERSPSAYAHNLDGDPTVKLQMPEISFRACSGAEAQHLLNVRFKDQAPQIGKIPTTTKVVVLSVGGNDAKFPRLAALCVFVDCAAQGYQDEFNAYLEGLDAELATVYQAILQRAPNTHIYVVGYPHILPLSDCSNAGDGSWWFALQALWAANPTDYKQKALGAGLTNDEANAALWAAPTISSDEVLWGRTFENKINLKVSEGVDLASVANPGRVHFVTATAPGSPAEGHQLCSADPHFNGIDPTKPAGNMFHPNFLGQIDLYELVRTAIAVHQPAYVIA